jgi:flavin reductase (DIM6/NTAB) family NADH-FMN oxidoreductase RutF
MQIDPSQQSARENYQLLIHCVIPRPIAWLGTVSGGGVNNLAPFSYFGAVTATPPTLMVSVGKRHAGPKDTARNLLAQREGVVHIPDRTLVERMVRTSAEVEGEVDEFALAGLTAVPATRVNAPRVAEAAVALECRVTQHLEVGSKKNDVFFLEVVYVHLRDDILVGNRPDPSKLQAVGRLGGDGYSDTTQPFYLPRPL